MSERKPLTLEELRKMDGKPAYWLDDDSYGIISVESHGRWADVPFFRGRKNGVNFEHNIKSRRIEVYAVEPPILDRSAWTAEWIWPSNEFNLPKCSKCGCNSKDATYGHKNNFCPKCGRAMNDAAWEMLERRIARHEQQ